MATCNSTSAKKSDDQSEVKQFSAPNHKHVLSESKKQNTCACLITNHSINPNPANHVTLVKAQKTLESDSCNNNPSQINPHGSSVETTSSDTRSNVTGFPAGRYNSPTDSLISPVSKGLLRRGKTRAYHYLRSSPHEPPSHVSLVPPKVLDNSYDV